MEKAHEKFLQEASELIDDLEKAVLQLERNPADKIQQEEVFRVMHTFKGTAKMFGFELIGEFTHYLENVYDDLRNGRLAPSGEILEVSLSSVDYIRTLLHNRTGDEKTNTMLSKVKALSEAPASQANTIFTTHSSVKKLFWISFQPAINFLKDGNNPLYQIEDIAAHGNILVKAHRDRLPMREEFVVDHAYLGWDIFLATDVNEKSIRHEFIFVEDQCELQIQEIGEAGLLNDTSFVDFINHFPGRLSIDAINSFFTKQRIAATQNTRPIATPNVQQQTIKVTYDKIDKLMSIVSELVTTQARLSLFTDGTKIPELEEISENVEKLVRQLRDEAFSISLLPMSHLSMRFERLVRDTSRELNKKINFITIGGETELDKKIIENLMDPLLHILRNSIDHGIESPDVRRRKGKDETGTIKLKSYYSGTNVIIEVIDDGGGINKDRVWQKAVQLGLADETKILSDREIFDFIFHPGFSTAKQVTNVSGRGVGMDVVRKSILNLRGEIEVDSQPEKGTTIRLVLPLSLSIIDGLLVDIERSKYVIPLSAIDKCYEVTSDSIKPDLNDLVVLDGEQIPYISLRKVFHCTGHQPAYVNLIVAKHDDRRVAFEVDNIIDEYQAVIKPLGKIYKDQDFASGATILGNGTVALVLYTNRLITRISDN